MCMFTVFIDPYNMRTIRGEKIIKLEMEMRTKFFLSLIDERYVIGRRRCSYGQVGATFETQFRSHSLMTYIKVGFFKLPSPRHKISDPSAPKCWTSLVNYPLWSASERSSNTLACIEG